MRILGVGLMSVSVNTQINKIPCPNINHPQFEFLEMFRSPFELHENADEYLQYKTDKQVNPYTYLII